MKTCSVVFVGGLVLSTAPAASSASSKLIPDQLVQDLNSISTRADELNPTHYGPPLPKPLPPGRGPPVSCDHDEDAQFLASVDCNISTVGKPSHHCKSVIRQWCAPRAANGTDCPTDFPPGNTTNGAKPTVFESDPGKKSCFLGCTRNSDCGGGAVCENKSLGTGACTWIVNGSMNDSLNDSTSAMSANEIAPYNSVKCVGSSAMLAPTECAAMQRLFFDWNMSQYPDCEVADPCNCRPPGKLGGCAVYCDADADGTGYVQGMSLSAVNPPLKGTISEAIGDLQRMNIMFLDANELTGTIPPALANMENLQSLNLLANRLSGTIPVGWGATTKLLYFGCNALTGTIPEMDFETLNANQGCEFHDNAAWCKEYFGPRPSNNFSCPLPAGAAQYCNATCS